MGLKTTCKEVHRLVSEGMDRDLTRYQKVRVRLHLIVCDVCTNFTKQMDFLRQALRRHPLD